MRYGPRFDDYAGLLPDLLDTVLAPQAREPANFEAQLKARYLP